MNPTFKDSQDREWIVRLTGPVIRDIQDTFGFKLTELDADPINQLANDPAMFVDVLFLLCENQAKGRAMDSRAFGECLEPGLDGPLEAVKEAIVSFFPAGKRSAIRAALKASEQVQNKAVEILSGKLTDPELMKRVEQKMVQQGEIELEKLLSQDPLNSSPSTVPTSATS